MTLPLVNIKTSLLVRILFYSYLSSVEAAKVVPRIQSMESSCGTVEVELRKFVLDRDEIEVQRLPPPRILENGHWATVPVTIVGAGSEAPAPEDGHSSFCRHWELNSGLQVQSVRVNLSSTYLTHARN